MGAVFFLAFMIIVFLGAVFLIIASITLIVIWKARKRSGKNPKKWWRLVSIVLLIVNVILALIPVGYLGFLRFSNDTNKDEVVYAESGKVLYWPMGEYGPTTSWFEMDGIKYERVPGWLNDSSFLDNGWELLGEPIANIKYDPSHTSAFNNFMWILLSGKTYSENNISTLYPIKNGYGLDLYYAENSPGSATVAGGAFINADQAPGIDILSVTKYSDTTGKYYKETAKLPAEERKTRE